MTDNVKIVIIIFVCLLAAISTLTTIYVLTANLNYKPRAIVFVVTSLLMFIIFMFLVKKTKSENQDVNIDDTLKNVKQSSYEQL